MEEKQWESNTICFLEQTLSSQSSDPLFSSIVAFYALILLYFPRHFLGIVFSPVLVFTGTLLLTLLRLGAIQRADNEFNSDDVQHTLDSPSDEDHKWDSLETLSAATTEMCMGFDLDPKPFYAESLVEWNVRAPLEVIYEEYEGEEEEEEEEKENDDSSKGKGQRRVMSVQKYPSLSLYYPETESDSSSDGEYPFGGWHSPDSMCFRWGEGDIRDELIEIALDGKRTSETFQVEEDNLIEIDIAPARNHELPAMVRYS